MKDQTIEEIDDFTQRFIEENILNNPTDDQLELHDKLRSMGGCSCEPEYLSLLGTCLAWGFQVGNKTYVINNEDSLNNKVFTILMSIPTLSTDTVHDFNEHTMLENMKTFLGKWFLKKNEEDVSDIEMRYLLERYISFFTAVSIPYALKDIFIEEIEKTKIIWRPISPEYEIKECPFCKKKVRVCDETPTHTCANCGNYFA